MSHQFTFNFGLPQCAFLPSFHARVTSELSQTQAQAPVSQPNGNESVPDNSAPLRPRREKRSTLAAKERLSNVVSGTTGGTQNRPRPRLVQGKKAKGIPRPARNSGLNPSGNPSNSQLNRPSEFIQTPTFTSDAASDPPSNPVHNPMPNFNCTGVYNTTATHGDGDGYGVHADPALPEHHDREPSSSTADNLNDFFSPFSDTFTGYPSPSTTNTCQGGLSLLSDSGVSSSLHARNNNVVPEQPLRPGEVRRGGITQSLPVSTWRTAAGADPPHAAASRPGTSVIRGSGNACDILARRHARRAPYRLPPTPARSASQSTFEASFPSNSRTTSPVEGTPAPVTTTTGTRRVKSSWPDCVVTSAKQKFRLSLLTSNAMWPDLTANKQAQEHLMSACLMCEVGTSWNVEKSVIQKVTHDGSNLRNEFKNVARQLVRGNCYDIYLSGNQDPNCEVSRKHIADRVAVLLDKKTGAWMHNGTDARGIRNYFEHPAVEETIIRTIFATPKSIGTRNKDKFRSPAIPTLALACCVLYCALEEWETGAFASVAFETSKYRMLYTAITDLNIRRILENLYMRGKLKALWARIYHHGSQVHAPQSGGVRTVDLFVEDIDVGPESGLGLDDATLALSSGRHVLDWY